MRPLVARCHFGLGALYSGTARGDQARAELGQAAELFRSMGMTLFLSRAEAALRQLG